MSTPDERVDSVEIFLTVIRYVVGDDVVTPTVEELIRSVFAQHGSGLTYTKAEAATMIEEMKKEKAGILAWLRKNGIVVNPEMN